MIFLHYQVGLWTTLLYYDVRYPMSQVVYFAYAIRMWVKVHVLNHGLANPQKLCINGTMLTCTDTEHLATHALVTMTVRLRYALRVPSLIIFYLSLLFLFFRCF